MRYGATTGEANDVVLRRVFCACFAPTKVRLVGVSAHSRSPERVLYRPPDARRSSCAELGDSAVAHHHDAIADLGLVEPVGDDQGGLTFAQWRSALAPQHRAAVLGLAS